MRLPPALRLRDFRLLIAAMLGMGLAGQMVDVAIGWQVYAIHRSALDLGLIGLAEFVPLPLLALPAGQLADRVPRRLVFALALVIYTTVAILLGLVPAVVAGGLVTIALAVVWARVFPSLTAVGRLEDLRPVTLGA